MTYTEQDVAFFAEHAGTSYDPRTETLEQGRIRGAIELAKAENDAKAQGITFSWEEDWTVGSHTAFYGPGSAYEDRVPETCEVALAWRSCPACGSRSVVASLGCVDDADDDYRRVVEAELASEALTVESQA